MDQTCHFVEEVVRIKGFDKGHGKGSNNIDFLAAKVFHALPGMNGMDKACKELVLSLKDLVGEAEAAN